MYIPNWGEDVITGNPQIDREHRELFIKIDSLMTAINRQMDEKEKQEIMEFFIIYARDHFAAEERLHLDMRAPRYEEHVAAHRRIANDITVMHRLINENGMTTQLELNLINKVLRGIIEQLHEFDLPLARFIQESEHWT